MTLPRLRRVSDQMVRLLGFGVSAKRLLRAVLEPSVDATGWGIDSFIECERSLTVKNDYTHISVLLDRTGSMQSIRDDTIGGFNTFLAAQQAQTGIATLTLVQFDSQDPYEVIHRFKSIKAVTPLTKETYVPRASTPLLDALGRGINDLGQQLAGMPEPERPEKIVFVVVTDGQENASREFNKAQVEKMIKEQTDVYKWQFVFLSSDLASISDAHALGVAAPATLQYAHGAAGARNAWDALSSKTVGYRASKAPSPSLEFDDKDREQSVQPDKL